MNFLESQDWSFPIPIAYGPGRLQEISRHCIKLGMHRPLVVTDRNSRELPFIGALEEYLNQGGLGYSRYADISPNPLYEEIKAGKAAYQDGNSDGIIAIGGGSGMDAGKAISLIANNDVELINFDYERSTPEIKRGSFPPLICIPTTAGTGAETDSTAMITDSKSGTKFCAWHPEHKPALALLDPALTLELPASLTAWTGCDALIHALEAYCVPGHHPVYDGIALEALSTISNWLPRVMEDGKNLEARGGMLVGSCQAGMAFVKGLGLVHAISHMVGAEYDTHHGLTNAVVLPAALRFNAPALTEKSIALAEAMGLKDRTFEGLYAAICQTLDELNIPATLAEIGVPTDCADRIAANAMLDTAAGTNPRPLDAQSIATVVEDALLNGR